MVVTRLMGGLGNQLFQYAAGRRLAHVLQTELWLDATWYADCGSRAYGLGVFDIEERFTSFDEFATLAAQRQGVVPRFLRRVFRMRREPAVAHVQEKHFHFDPKILSLRGNVYLDGYWQCGKYFADVEEIIRQEFTVKASQQGLDKDLAERIRACESVSVHVRRGDYVTAKVASQVLGAVSANYYDRAVRYIAHRVKRPSFFVFSDDPEWVHLNLNLPYPTTVVDHNGPEKGYEDMRLMGQCKHHIIANSTFSWWGAWLCRNARKTVVAPKRWFSDASWSSRDIVPSSWIRL